jgi:integrin beta 3
VSPRGADRPDDDQRNDSRSRRLFGRGRPEPVEPQDISQEETGWLDDLRTAKEQRAAIGPGALAGEAKTSKSGRVAPGPRDDGPARRPAVPATPDAVETPAPAPRGVPITGFEQTGSFDGFAAGAPTPEPVPPVPATPPPTPATGRAGTMGRPAAAPVSGGGAAAERARSSRAWDSGSGEHVARAWQAASGEHAAAGWQTGPVAPDQGIRPDQGPRPGHIARPDLDSRPGQIPRPDLDSRPGQIPRPDLDSRLDQGSRPI